ncbi:O-antigen ligase domain-containing protein [Flaviflexus ciconiae]|uniref:O-antigen ligase domain-containing protein n=1 Tax=Flaviflexus ciconiae TaxID=2496867 RepID=A0A3Q9G1G0_9ACTO|nr:O-antigen ligase family protein [Flaviflexus ciconiae]AZQ76754.1 O-antigen ligase domain-containing protein [Flaviflexus ciconiae]
MLSNVKQFPRGKVKYSPSKLEIAFYLYVGVWLVWLTSVSLLSGKPPAVTSPYVVVPVVLIGGILLGQVLALRWTDGRTLELAFVALALAILATPIYANASAAVGVQLVALASLGIIGRQRIRSVGTEENEQDTAVPSRQRAPSQQILIVGLFLIGTLLALGSQAAIALLIPLLVVSFWAIRKCSGPPRWLLVGAGIFVAEMAAIAVITLGIRESWSPWLSADDSLSSARHTLWSDALALWRANPIAGAGPGTFTESSELASSTPDLAAVHSIVLQVAAELGAIGLLLLGAIFVLGLLLVTRGPRDQSLIAAAAWTSLAVHASIDHLEDFPVVWVTVGLVLGFSMGLSKAQRRGAMSGKGDAAQCVARA